MKDIYVIQYGNELEYLSAITFGVTQEDDVVEVVDKPLKAMRFNTLEACMAFIRFIKKNDNTLNKMRIVKLYMACEDVTEWA